MKWQIPRSQMALLNLNKSQSNFWGSQIFYFQTESTTPVEIWNHSLLGKVCPGLRIIKIKMKLKTEQ